MRRFFLILAGLIAYVCAHIALEAMKKPEDPKKKRAEAMRLIEETRLMQKTGMLDR